MNTEALSAEKIRMHLQPVGADLCRRIYVFAQIDSTSSWLIDRLRVADAVSGDVCLADTQTAGRGRRGRSWSSQATGNLYLSVAWTAMNPRMSAASVTLALGLNVAETLAAQTGAPIGLKWPNDVYLDNRKLAGILVEGVTGPTGSHWVIGVGLNLVAPQLPPEANPRAVGLVECWPDALERRNAIAGAIVEAVLTACVQFEHHGLAGVHERWARHDLTRDRPVEVHRPDGSVLLGKGGGIDERGRLRVVGDFMDCWLDAGEVSLRLC